MILTLGSHLISSIGFEKKVPHIKRVRERQTDDDCYHFARENFWSEEKKREKVDLGEKTNPSSEIEKIFEGHVSQDKHKLQGINY